jgi:hypothetical protein
LRAFRAPTLTQLHDKLCYEIVESPPEKLDVITTVDVQIHNVIAEAQSMEWEFDLKNMWLTKSRWSMMARQYIDPEEFQAWIDQCAGKIGLKGRGIAVMRTKVVKPRGGPAQGNKETRRWGSCMLAISYKAKPHPQITLYSRTSYLGYLAALDLSVAWMAARYLAHAMGVPVETFSFVWMNEAMQYHNFKSLAYLLNHPDPELKADYRAMILSKKMKKSQAERLQQSPALKLSRRWMSRLQAADEKGETLGDMTYNTYRRIRRRYHTEVMGYEYAQQFEGWSYYKKGPKEGEQKEFFKAYQPLPSVPIETLDFSPIGLPLTGVTPVDYTGSDDDWDEEDD